MTFPFPLKGVHPRLILPATLVLCLVTAPFLLPMIFRLDPVGMSVTQRFAAPSAEHWLGLDEFGRDRLARILIGAQASIQVAITAALISCGIGTLMGLAGAYFRGIASFAATRLAEVVLCFPPILLALLIVTLMGPGTTTLIWVLSILYFPTFARIVFLETARVGRLEYVTAAQALGARAPRVMFGTILPNIAGPIAVQFSLTTSAAILVESGLSYLGLGVVPPAPSWGQIIRGARSYMAQDPLGIILPCAAISITIWGINFFTDRLRDALDPKRSSGGISLLRRRRKSIPESAAPQETLDDTIVLSIRDLTIRAKRGQEFASLIEDVSLSVRRGQCTALVGESGSGKSLTAAAALGLLPRGIEVSQGNIFLQSRGGKRLDVLGLTDEELEKTRGRDAAMIFQEPMTALNPVHKVGAQLIEAAQAHSDLSRAQARAETLNLLRMVGVNDPERRFNSYPHVLSGGLRQRVVIAMALSMRPGLILADEPTTALDVTVQAAIIDLLIALKNSGSDAPGLLFISHNLGVVAQLADEIAVMYAGRIVEWGPAASVLGAARHPYTQALLQSMPAAHAELHASRGDLLPSISGVPPMPHERPAGCAFRPRCRIAVDRCIDELPRLAPVASASPVAARHVAACHLMEPPHAIP